MRISTLRICSYDDAAALLAGRQSLRLCPNTVLEADPPENPNHAIRVRLHSTDIVTYSAGGRIELRSGGWRTLTTKRRINACLPRNHTLIQKDGQWWVTLPQAGISTFYEGFFLLGRTARSPYVPNVPKKNS